MRARNGWADGDDIGPIESFAVEFKAVRKHDDGLRASLAFIHGETDRLSPVGEQTAAQASRISNDPLSEPVLADEQGSAEGRSGCNVRLMNHEGPRWLRGGSAELPASTPA